MTAFLTSPPAALKIADWASKFEAGTISGSVYAVAPSSRLDAGKLLTHHGHGVHVDLILTTDGRHRGVTLEELLLLRTSSPDAHIDVHLILPTASISDDVAPAAEQAIRTAVQVKARSLTLPPHASESFAALLDDVRKAGLAVWTEVAVGTQISDGKVDGALVMLIDSGTQNAADSAQLQKIPALATTMAVGVDGGVTASVAAAARDAGADVIVSGRALFQTIK